MVAIPIGKLAYMGMRQLSKPIATRLKNYSKEHPILRNQIILPTAQAYHRLGQTIRLRMLGSKNMEIIPLSESSAIELGAELFGELFIFFTGALLVTMEYLRQKRVSALKEQDIIDRINRIEDKLLTIDNSFHNVDTIIQKLIYDLHNKTDHTIKASPND